VELTNLQPKSITNKTFAPIKADVGNDLRCSAYIPDTSIKSLRSSVEVYGSCSAICCDVWEKCHRITPSLLLLLFLIYYSLFIHFL
jgi:hypothetical protein